MKDIADYPTRFAIAHPTQLRDLPSRFDHTTASEGLYNAMDLERYFDTILNILAEVSHVPAESITTRTSIHYTGIDSTVAIHVASLYRKAALKLSSIGLGFTEEQRAVCAKLSGKTPGAMTRRCRRSNCEEGSKPSSKDARSTSSEWICVLCKMFSCAHQDRSIISDTG